VGVFVVLLFRSNYLVFVSGAVACEGVGFGDVNGDDSGSIELLRLCEFIDQLSDRLSVHLANLLDREISNVVAVGVSEWCSIPRGLMNETAGSFVRSQPLAQSEIRLEVPVGVLVYLTAVPTVQRKRREHDAADVVGDLLCLLQRGLIGWF